MNAGELIKQLKKLPKDYEVLLHSTEESNIWLSDLEVSFKGESGYEEEGEIRLIGTE